MKRILLLLVILYPIFTWGQKSDLIIFLDACKTYEFEESKEIISNYSFDSVSMYNIMSYEEPIGILFNTDTLDIKGFKAIINCKLKSEVGQYIEKKMIAILYLNKTNNHWCVEMFREALDPNKEFNSSKNKVDLGEYYTKKQYVYRNLAYWAISAGKLSEAIKYIKLAEEEATNVNDIKFNRNSQKEIISKIL